MKRMAQWFTGRIEAMHINCVGRLGISKHACIDTAK